VRGESSRAISLLQRVCELNPIDMDARNDLIELMSERGKPQQTLQEYIKLSETYYNLADLAMARKTYTRAFRFAQTANIDRESKVKLLHRMADIDMQSLDWRNAIRVYEQIRTIEPGRADLMVAGLAIIDAIFTRWHYPELIVVDAGLLEGVLGEMAAAFKEEK